MIDEELNKITRFYNGHISDAIDEFHALVIIAIQMV
jgi:hypothetical protein